MRLVVVIDYPDNVLDIFDNDIDDMMEGIVEEMEDFLPYFPKVLSIKEFEGSL